MMWRILILSVVLGTSSLGWAQYYQEAPRDRAWVNVRLPYDADLWVGETRKDGGSRRQVSVEAPEKGVTYVIDVVGQITRFGRKIVHREYITYKQGEFVDVYLHFREDSIRFALQVTPDSVVYVNGELRDKSSGPLRHLQFGSHENGKQPYPMEIRVEMERHGFKLSRTREIIGLKLGDNPLYDLRFRQKEVDYAAVIKKWQADELAKVQARRASTLREWVTQPNEARPKWYDKEKALLSGLKEGHAKRFGVALLDAENSKRKTLVATWEEAWGAEFAIQEETINSQARQLVADFLRLGDQAKVNALHDKRIEESWRRKEAVKARLDDTWTAEVARRKVEFIPAETIAKRAPQADAALSAWLEREEKAIGEWAKRAVGSHTPEDFDHWLTLEKGILSAYPHAIVRATVEQAFDKEAGLRRNYGSDLDAMVRKEWGNRVAFAYSLFRERVEAYLRVGSSRDVEKAQAGRMSEETSRRSAVDKEMATAELGEKQRRLEYRGVSVLLDEEKNRYPKLLPLAEDCEGYVYQRELSAKAFIVLKREGQEPKVIGEVEGLRDASCARGALALIAKTVTIEGRRLDGADPRGALLVVQGEEVRLLERPALRGRLFDRVRGDRETGVFHIWMARADGMKETEFMHLYHPRWNELDVDGAEEPPEDPGRGGK